jgi:hypothetical protein
MTSRQPSRYVLRCSVSTRIEPDTMIISYLRTIIELVDHQTYHTVVTHRPRYKRSRQLDARRAIG